MNINSKQFKEEGMGKKVHVRTYSYGMLVYVRIFSKRHTCRTKRRQTAMQSRTVITVNDYQQYRNIQGYGRGGEMEGGHGKERSCRGG